MLADSPVVDYGTTKKKKSKGEAKDYSNVNLAEKAAASMRKYEQCKEDGSDNLENLNINGVKIKL